MEGGVVTFAEAFGSKDPDGLEPLTPHTLMQIGSTTKHMTAVALLRLVDSGQVSLDDTLEELLPEMDFARDATWDDQVTLHLMLSHQGAFYDAIPWDGPPDDSELAAWTYGTYDRDSYLMNPPGAFWNYSNPNFVFVGLVTETVDGRAWPDIMREDVFLPLGMDRTFLRKTEVEADGDFALSYGMGTDDLMTGAEGPVDMEHMPDPGWARPAGLWSGRRRPR
jgi:CubicO group peptidase (beta-lactamase class C family)